MTEEKAKSLIGRKVRGFKFEDYTNDITYHPSMDDFIGKVGVILDISSTKNFIVAFDTHFWSYPASLIEAHLVGESLDRKISDFKETEPISESDLIELLPISEDSKKGLIKFQDLIKEIEQLKADKVALVKALEIYLNAGHKEARREASIIAKQTLEKHGK